MKSKPIAVPVKNMFSILDPDTPEQSPNNDSLDSHFIEISPTFSNIIKLQDKINKHKVIDTNTTFNSIWDIWFHINPDDWSINSYEKIWNITTIDDFYNFFYRFDLIEEAKMINLYFFRNNIIPTWEDPANAKGACLSIKVNDINTGYHIFNLLCGYSITESLIKIDNDKFDYNGLINGISLNLKKNNLLYNKQLVIIKIWISDYRYAKEIYQKNLLNHNIIKILNIQKYSIIYQIINPHN